MLQGIQTEQDIDTVARMAGEIWRQHFGGMFSEAQLSVMIDSTQSKQAIAAQISHGYEYFFVHHQQRVVGYMAYRIDTDKNELFLSKLYLHADHRGRGIGRKVVAELERLCAESNIERLTLTVYNGNTSSIRAYENWGFETKGMIKREFAEDLVFDDYLMQKQIG